jgi:hypothetical protein
VTGTGRLPRARWLVVLLAGLLAAGQGQAALRISVDGPGLSPSERRDSQQLVEDVLQRAPPALRARATRPLRLRWREDLPEHVQGRAHGDTLGLDRRLLDALDGGHEPDWAVARAALVHELAHALDRAPDGGWSKQARFRDLAGWQERPLWPGRGRNRFTLRSPDAYERDNPVEFFAVNFEHYLLDPQFGCRRPALAAWYAAQLGDLPAEAAATCAPAVPLMKAGEQEGSAELVELDPARVYQVDYLLAEGNDVLMSRWGHSMLRLVVCAPGRPPGPACRMDLQHHLVLSFRAFVGDVQISNWRGLTGSYPSRLFVLPLNRVIDEYTKVELRGVSSMPLALDRQEITGLLQQAAQLHWSYDGRYFFISNNCAVETWKLLRDGAPRLGQADLQSITPTGLRAKLQRQYLLAAAPQDTAEAVRGGYYFESAAGHYALVFALAREALGLPVADVAHWLALPAGQRRSWMERADGQSLAALFLLEQAGWRRQELLARDRLKRELLGGKDAARQHAEFLALMQRAGLLVAPGGLPLGGYGIPTPAERDLARGAVAAGAPEAIAQWSALRAEALALLPAGQQAQMAGIESNLDYLRQRLRLRYGTSSSLPVVLTGERGRGRLVEGAVEHGNE